MSFSGLQPTNPAMHLQKALRFRSRTKYSKPFCSHALDGWLSSLVFRGLLKGAFLWLIDSENAMIYILEVP